MAELGAWNEALLDVVLPVEVNAGQPVVFSCDDESVRLAGARLGIDDREALPDLLEACRRAWRVNSTRGLSGLAVDTRAFRAAPRPRPCPPWLTALALAVVSASRMNREHGRVTQDYYGRLLELFALAPAPGHPPLVGFDLLEPIWTDFAVWLAEDQGERRGLLELPLRPAQRHVGLPISQTIFRRRDRALLGRFFDRHRANIEAGFDILRLLRGWGSRHGLTTHALETIQNDGLARLARSALRAAYAAWDGSHEDEAGRRSWPSRLRLAASPRRVVLYLSVERYAEGGILEGPEGQLELPPFPRELELPLSWLERLGRERLFLPVAGRDEAVAVPSGRTFLFELRDEGLMHVQAAREEAVWVLSCEVTFHAPDFDDCRYAAAVLPFGWTLLAAVAPERLPAGHRENRRADVADLTLVGGLRLADGAYLIGHPPTLAAGELDKPLEVTIDGGRPQTLDSFEQLELVPLDPGTHWIDAGVVQFEIELAERGLQEGVGGLRWDIGDAPLFRNGATRPGRAGRAPVGPFVCGAALDGVQRAPRELPLLLRTDAPVFVIYGDGQVLGCGRPQPAGWLRQIGLADGAHRWRVPRGERAEWVVVAGRARRVLRAGTGDVELTPEVADVAHRFAEAPVQALVGENDVAAAAWAGLCRDCEEAYEPV